MKTMSRTAFESMDPFLPVHRFFWEGKSIPGWREPRRRIYDCEFVYLSQGSFTLEMAGQRHALQQGAIVIVPPATWHESWTVAGETAMRHCIHFDWTPELSQHRPPLQSFFGDPFPEDQVHPVPASVAAALPLTTTLQEHPGLQPVVELMLSLLREQIPMADHLLWAVLRQLTSTQTHSAGSTMTDRRRRAVSDLKQFIDTRYADPIGYPEFQSLTRLSASHLCRAFTHWLGRTPTAYLNDLRLQHARRLLLTSSLTVKEVAAAVGIPDTNYFARLYRRKFGVRPSAREQ